AVAGRSAGRRAAGALHAARGVRPAGAGRAARPGGHQLDALVEVSGADEAAVAAAVVAGTERGSRRAAAVRGLAAAGGDAHKRTREKKREDLRVLRISQHGGSEVSQTGLPQATKASTR